VIPDRIDRRLRCAGQEIDHDQFALAVPAAFDEGSDVGGIMPKKRVDFPRLRIGQARGIDDLVESPKPTSNDRHPARGAELATAALTIGAPTIKAIPKAVIS
jgi:hypothetical protein